MSDFSYTEESEDERSSETEKHIQRIIALTKEGTKKPGTSTASKKKKKNTHERREDLFKQFNELKEFEKTLAETFLKTSKGKGAKKTNKKQRSLPEENENKSSDSSENSSSVKEFPKRKTDNNEKEDYRISKKYEAYRTGSSSGDSTDEAELNERSVSELTESSERSASEEAESSDSSKDEEPQRGSKQTITSRTRNGPDRSSEKNIPLNSQAEYEKIKNLCEKILRNEKQKRLIREITSEEDMEKTEARKYKTTKMIISPRTLERKSLSNDSDMSKNTKFTPKKMSFTNDFKNLQLQEKCSTQPNGYPASIEKEKITSIESFRKQNHKTEQCGCEDETIKANATTSNFIDQKEVGKVNNSKNLLSTTCNEEPTKFHLQIVSKGSDPREQEESKHRECTDEGKGISDNFTEDGMDANETKETTKANENWIKENMEKYALSNQCDDELIRQTVQELVEIQESTEVEDSNMVSEQKEDIFQQRGMGDGDNNTSYFTSQERIEMLQEQIENLKKKLEEARQYNQQEARDIAFMSSLLREQSTPVIRKGGLDWEEWELKEMVQERLKEKREAAALDYQTRLRVVDALCSAELGRLEDALETLVPLNAAASSWCPVDRPTDLRTSWMTQDYVLEVVTSMNLSSSKENTLSAEHSKKGELTTSVESKPESQ